MRMRNAFLTILASCAAFAVSPTAPAAAAEETEIAWAPTLSDAFAAAKKEGKPVFIAINSTRVDGGKAEPAGKELREHTYKDAAVIAKSKAFSCALLLADGSSADYAEIRQRFGVEGTIVSPQHLFAYPDGTKLDRREYWPYGTGASAVTALIDMMNSALKAVDLLKNGGTPPPPTEPTPAPGTDKPGEAAPRGDPSKAGAPSEARADWIRTMIENVRKGSAAKDARDAAIKQLAASDQKGDCFEPLCNVMIEAKKDTETQIAILKVLGRNGLVIAAPATWSLLDEKDDDVRSNAAVTLEYIGDPRAAEPLAKRIRSEREETIHNNMCRALGRCGANLEDVAKRDGVRKALLHEIEASKSPKGSAGPIIGLAYFEKDADAARGIEKLLKKEGDWTKRCAMEWTLCEIGDPKSGEFVKKEIWPQQSKNAYAKPFADAVVAYLSDMGDTTAKGAVDGGFDFAARSLAIGTDSARRGREAAQTDWKPKGEVAAGPPRMPPGGMPPGMGG